MLQPAPAARFGHLQGFSEEAVRLLVLSDILRSRSERMYQPSRWFSAGHLTSRCQVSGEQFVPFGFSPIAGQHGPQITCVFKRLHGIAA